MGRGLSDLQKCVLRLALDEVGVSRTGGQRLGADARYRDIRKAFYGIERSTPATSAAISRACDRLAKRGYVTLVAARYSRWSGVDMTDEGRQVAQELSANKVSR